MSVFHADKAFHPDPVLQVRNLCVDYITDNGDFNAVKSVSFDIGRGEILASQANRGAEKVPLPLRSIAFTNRPHLFLGGKFCLKVAIY